MLDGLLVVAGAVAPQQGPRPQLVRLRLAAGVGAQLLDDVSAQLDDAVEARVAKLRLREREVRLPARRVLLERSPERGLGGAQSRLRLGRAPGVDGQAVELCVDDAEVVVDEREVLVFGECRQEALLRFLEVDLPVLRGALARPEALKPL